MTAKHRRFADVAGYTRHCWECRHAKGWKDSGTIDGKCATCELTGRTVTKFNSPNNPCSNLPCGCDYETGGAAMTATEELRRMLDERGVDYRFNDATKVFEWHFDGTDGGGSAHATEVDGCINIIACSLTPAQAIAATLGDEGVARSNDGVAELGAGTCHNASKVMDEYGQARFACSECGAWIDSRMLWNPEYRNGESPWVSGCKLNYCPNCGRRIVGPTADGADGHEGHWLTGERIVRCGDCRYYDEIIHACDHPCVTPLRGDCPENWIFSCFEKDFCCWGKRKEVD